MRKSSAYFGDSQFLVAYNGQNSGLSGSGSVAKIATTAVGCVEEMARLENHRGPRRLALLLGLSKA